MPSPPLGPMSLDPIPPVPIERTRLADLFLGFLSIGAMSFGGGLVAWIRRETVQRRAWVDDRQFLTFYALSQIVPGANNVNLAVFIGARLRGIPGALAAFAGLMAIPTALIMVVGTLYATARSGPEGALIARALSGMGAAAIGLNLATGLRLGKRNLHTVPSSRNRGGHRRSGRPARRAAAGGAGGAGPAQPCADLGGSAAMTVTLIQLAALFSLLSVLAVGGGAGVIPDMQRSVVNVHHWMSAPEFLDSFAISRAAPGPGSLIVLLVGQKAAGLAGAAVAGVAMFLPSSVLAYLTARFWHRAGEAGWRQLVERALAPVAVGLTIASALALIRGTEHGMATYLVTGVATLLLALTELNPLAMLAAGTAALLIFG